MLCQGEILSHALFSAYPSAPLDRTGGLSASLFGESALTKQQYFNSYDIARHVFNTDGTCRVRGKPNPQPCCFCQHGEVHATSSVEGPLNVQPLDKLVRDLEFLETVFNRDISYYIENPTYYGDLLMNRIVKLMMAIERAQTICLETGIKMDSLAHHQSGEPGRVSVDDSEQQMDFHDISADVSEEIPTFIDELRTTTNDNKVTLQDFMSRPVLIDSTTWVIGTTPSFPLYPWSDFFGDRRVENRLTNFKNLRCKLKVRILINGTPFHYGRMMISYLPLSYYDECDIVAPTTFGGFCEASQRNKTFLNPTCQQGVEYTLPFFWHENTLDITERDWIQMGRLDFTAIAPLQHANNAVDPVTITTYVWAEDVEFNVPTTVNIPGLAAQSGKGGTEIDEANAKGTISKPASAAAKTMASLAVIPSLRPYALASSMALQGIGNLAKLMGYSRPTETKTPDRMKPTLGGSFAVCNVPDLVQKLTVDELNELTIDPRISGIGPDDPLNIQQIASVEAFLTQFTWAQSAAPGDHLYNVRVSPELNQLTGAAQVHFTPMAFLCQFFNQWTGKLKFRFQFVASAYHRGRVRITYDPSYNDAPTEHNLAYSTVIDISEESDFIIEVGQVQPRSTLILNHDIANRAGSTTPYNTYESGSNGVLSMYVLNELTTPNSVSAHDILVNVFVSAGDDFELFNPGGAFMAYCAKPQSGDAGTSIDSICAPDIPKSKVLCSGTTNRPNLNRIHYGESITSMRTLLRRYNLHEIMSKGPASFGPFTTAHWRKSFPFFRGNVPSPLHLTAASAGYNYCNTTVLNIMSLLFAGKRGSVRYKFFPYLSQSPYGSNIYVERLGENGPLPAADVFPPTPTYATKNASAFSGVTPNGFAGDASPPLGPNGVACTFGDVNPMLEVEQPYYSEYRFEPGRKIDYTNPAFTTFNAYCVHWTGVEDNTCTLCSYVCAGEDFQFYYFVGVPSLYYEGAPPAPKVIP